MINANPSNSPLPTTPSSQDAATVASTPTQPTNPSFEAAQGMKSPKKRKFDWKMIAGAIVMGLIVVGAAAGFYITNFTNLDVRQYASVGTPDGGGQCGVDGCAGWQLKIDGVCTRATQCLVPQGGPCSSDNYCMGYDPQNPSDPNAIRCVNGTCQPPTTTGPAGQCPVTYQQNPPTCDNTQQLETINLGSIFCHRCVDKTKPEIEAGELCTVPQGCICSREDIITGEERTDEIQQGQRCVAKTCWYESNNTCTSSIFKSDVTCQGKNSQGKQLYPTEQQCKDALTFSQQQDNGEVCATDANCKSGYCKDEAGPLGADACAAKGAAGASCEKDSACTSGFCDEANNVCLANSTGGPVEKGIICYSSASNCQIRSLKTSNLSAQCSDLGDNLFASMGACLQQLPDGADCTAISDASSCSINPQCQLLANNTCASADTDNCTYTYDSNGGWSSMSCPGYATCSGGNCNIQNNACPKDVNGDQVVDSKDGTLFIVSQYCDGGEIPCIAGRGTGQAQGGTNPLPIKQCGSGQIDIRCTGGNSVVAYSSYTNPNACTESPSTPPASTPPGSTPPPVGPQCLSILMRDANNELVTEPKYNAQVKFVCAEVAGVHRYEFRVRKPDGNIVNVAPINTRARQSQLFTIDAFGSYAAQCRICTSDDAASCQPWENFPAGDVSPHETDGGTTNNPAPSPAPNDPPTDNQTSSVRGRLNRADCDLIRGWACNVNQSGSDQVEVSIFADGRNANVGGTLLQRLTANLDRGQSVTDKCGDPNHGFQLDMPESLKDGQTHDIYAFAVVGGQRYDLTGSPLTFDSSECSAN